MVKGEQVQGMILAAGFGMRMRPLTLERPKALMEVVGQPLIYYALMHMHAAKVKSIVINTHFLGDQIEKAVGDEFDGIPVHYFHETDILETGGALKNASGILAVDEIPTLLMNADILIDLNFDELWQAQQNDNALAALVLKTVPNPEKFGAIGTNKNDQVKTIVHHVPYDGEKLRERMFCGTHLISPEIFQYFPSKAKFRIIDELYAPLVLAGQIIVGVEQKGYYADIGNPQSLFRVNMAILNQEVKFISHNFFARFTQARPGVWLGKNVQIAKTAKLKGPIVIDDEVIIDEHAEIGPNVIVGKKCVVNQNTQLSNAVVMSRSVLAAGTSLDRVLIDKQIMVKVD
ncbi:MAG: NDP-sugar synthase [bacterium]|nr:NDP-sugar synthase [bacterium]